MGVIHELDQELINKIAAGEVVERPASVVKELVENSLDAGAKSVRIEVLGAGSELIRVSDDGSGMCREDALLAPKRHATSKIADDADLFAIETLGFRGEALSSIAAVARVRIRTRTAAEDVGTEVLVEGTDIRASDAAVPVGTRVEVRDLFYNTPARRKHLKGPATEMRHLIEVVQRYALAYPHVGFSLHAGGEEVLSAPATGDMMAAIVSVYGASFAKELLPVKFESPHVEVSGYIGKPTLTKADTQHQVVFINSRHVTNAVVARAVNDAYHTLMHLERKPVAILSLEMSPRLVDVNVHPTKREVRLSHEELVYQAVFEAVRSTLSEHQLIPTHEFEAQRPLIAPRLEMSGLSPAGSIARDAQSRAQPGQPLQQAQPARPADITAASQLSLGEVQPYVEGTDRFPSLKVLGQLHDTYILAECDDGLCVVDQHAAQERVFYERFMERHLSSGLKTQQLLSPVVMELSPAEMRLVEEHAEVLASVGFEVEPFGQGAVVCRTAPVLFGRVQDERFFCDLIAGLTEFRDLSREQREERLIRRACRSAVKANDPLELGGMRSIVEELSQCRMPFTCPHGRPTLFRLTLHELERRFKRVS